MDESKSDRLRAIRGTAEREIARIDAELVEHPNSPALAEARREWAQLAYYADAELHRCNSFDPKTRLTP